MLIPGDRLALRKDLRSWEEADGIMATRALPATKPVFLIPGIFFIPGQFAFHGRGNQYLVFIGQAPAAAAGASLAAVVGLINLHHTAQRELVGSVSARRSLRSMVQAVAYLRLSSREVCMADTPRWKLIKEETLYSLAMTRLLLRLN